MSKPREDPSKTDAEIANPQLKGASGFGALAGYLFGKNEHATAMKMTTPVFTVRSPPLSHPWLRSLVAFPAGLKA